MISTKNSFFICPKFEKYDDGKTAATYTESQLPINREVELQKTLKLILAGRAETPKNGS